MIVLNVLGYLWAVPTTLVCFLFFILPMWIFGQLTPLGWKDGAFEWVINPGCFFNKKYGGWAATTLGFNIMLSAKWVLSKETAVHERHHVWQNKILGPLFLPLYVLGYLVGGLIGIFNNTDKLTLAQSIYWYNPFESNARDYTKSKFGY